MRRGSHPKENGVDYAQRLSVLRERRVHYAQRLSVLREKEVHYAQRPLLSPKVGIPSYMSPSLLRYTGRHVHQGILPLSGYTGRHVHRVSLRVHREAYTPGYTPSQVHREAYTPGYTSP